MATTRTMVCLTGNCPNNNRTWRVMPRQVAGAPGLVVWDEFRCGECGQPVKLQGEEGSWAPGVVVP